MLIATIRPALPSELDAVAGLARSALPELTVTHAHGWAHRAGDGSTPQDHLLLVCVVDGVVVGMAAAGPSQVQEMAPVPWWVFDVLAVDETMRNRGIGDELMVRVFAAARAAGVTSLYGLCSPDLGPWYAKRGFTVTAPGAVLETNVRFEGEDEDFTLQGRSDECFILTDVVEGPGPRLFRPA